MRFSASNILAGIAIGSFCSGAIARALSSQALTSLENNCEDASCLGKSYRVVVLRECCISASLCLVVQITDLVRLLP